MIVKVNRTTTALLFTLSLLLIGAPVAWLLYAKFQSNERYLQQRSFAVLHQTRTHLDNKFKALAGLFKRIPETTLCTSELSPAHEQLIRNADPEFKRELTDFLDEGGTYVTKEFDEEVLDSMTWELRWEHEWDTLEDVKAMSCSRDSGAYDETLCGLSTSFSLVEKPSASATFGSDDFLIEGVNALGSWGCRIGIFAESSELRSSGLFELPSILQEVRAELFSILDEIIPRIKEQTLLSSMQVQQSKRFTAPEEDDALGEVSDSFASGQQDIELAREELLLRVKRNKLLDGTSLRNANEQQGWFPISVDVGKKACTGNDGAPFVRFMAGARGMYMMRCLDADKKTAGSSVVDRNYFQLDMTKLLLDNPTVSPFDLMMVVNIDGGVITTVKSPIEDVQASTSFNSSHFAHINDFLKGADDKSKQQWEEVIKPLYEALKKSSKELGKGRKDSTLERLPAGAATSLNITIGEMPFRLYLMPYELPYPVVSRNRLQQAYLVLAGLIPMEEARASKFSLSPSMAALALAIVLLLVAVWPILRFRFMGINQAMGANEFRIALAGVALFALTITLAATDLLVYSNAKQHIQRQLMELAIQARDQVGDEFASKRQLLKQIWQVQLDKKTSGDSSEVLRCIKPLTDASKSQFDAVNCSRDDVNKLSEVEHYFLLNRAGRQVGPFYTWYPFNLLDKGALELAHRDYFKKLHLGKGWISPEGEPFYLQHIFSHSDGLRSTVASIKLPPNDWGADVAVAEFHVQNLLEPVLPYGYELAVVENKSGNVLYHSRPELSLLENFLVATDHDRDLKLALSSNQDMTLRVRYQGKPHYIATLSLASQGIPWSVVVMYDHSLLQIVNFNVLLMVLVSMLMLMLCLSLLLWAGKLFTPALSWLWPNFYRRDVYPWLIVTAVISLLQGVMFGFGVEHATVLTVVYCLVLLMFNWANLCLQVAHGPLTTRWRRNTLVTVALLAALSDIVVTWIVWHQEQMWNPTTNFHWNAAVVTIAMVFQVVLMLQQLKRFPPEDCNCSDSIGRTWAQRLHPLHGGLMLCLVVVLPTLILYHQISKHQIYLYGELSSAQIGKQMDQQFGKSHWLLETLYPKLDGSRKDRKYPAVDKKGVSLQWIQQRFQQDRKNGCGPGVFGLACVQDAERNLFNVSYAAYSGARTPATADIKEKGFYDYLISLTTPLSEFAARIGFRAASKPKLHAPQIERWAMKESQVALAGLKAAGAQNSNATVVPVLPTAFAMAMESIWLMLLALLLIGGLLYKVFRSLAERSLGLLIPRVLEQRFPHRGLMRQVLHKATKVPGGVLMIWPGQRKLMRYRRWLGSEHGIHWLDLADPNAELPMRYGQGVSSPLPRLEGWEVVVCYNLEVAAASDELRGHALSLLQKLLERRQSLDAMGFVLCCERSPLYRLIRNQAYEQPAIGSSDRHYDNENQQWAQLFSCLRKFYAWSPQHQGFGLMPDEDIKQHCYWLSKREAGVWPDLRLIHFEFKRWYTRHAPTSFEPQDLETWYIANAGSIYRRKWELCTRDEKVALYQLATGSFINCHNLEVIEHLERGGYVVRDPRLRVCNRSFERFVLAAERSEVMEEWLQQASVSAWNLIRIPLLTLILVAVGAVLYLFNTELESLAAALAAAPAIIALLARGMAFVRGSPVSD
ncbi:hypothetical protein ACFSJ3_18065 [Corallincola platygyrae]|uniref:Cache domain-containing protein n=1 Tax=Corallincola platygyrae TaxID=1193278 RepID=A0ABW4XQT2_9GAMM